MFLSVQHFSIMPCYINWQKKKATNKGNISFCSQTKYKKKGVHQNLNPLLPDICFNIKDLKLLDLNLGMIVMIYDLFFVLCSFASLVLVTEVRWFRREQPLLLAPPYISVTLELHKATALFGCLIRHEKHNHLVVLVAPEPTTINRTSFLRSKTWSKTIKTIERQKYSSVE